MYQQPHIKRIITTDLKAWKRKYFTMNELLRLFWLPLKISMKLSMFISIINHIRINDLEDTATITLDTFKTIEVVYKNGEILPE